MLVLGGGEALITNTDVGALQVLTGPMGQAQARVLAALIYVWREQGEREAGIEMALTRTTASLPGECPEGLKLRT